MKKKETLGIYLKRKRKEKGLFARELGSLIGASQQFVFHMEADLLSPPFSKIPLLMKILNLDSNVVVMGLMIQKTNRAMKNLSSSLKKQGIDTSHIDFFIKKK